MALDAGILKQAIVSALDAVFPPPDGMTDEQLAAFNDARDKFANAIASPDVSHIVTYAEVNVLTPGVQTGTSTLPGTGGVT